MTRSGDKEPERARYQRLYARVRGRVQMVGYRAFAQAAGVEWGLTGYARNALDGDVEVVAEGPRERLEPFLEALRRGPRAARVDAVDCRWSQAAGEFRSFHIGY